MAATFRFRPTAPSDLAAMALLEEAAFSDPWSADALQEALMAPGALSLVALDPDGTLVGAALGRVVADEGELLSISVSPAMRGRGIGRELLARMLSGFTEQGAATVWLEVRAGNEAAKGLYRAAGFQTAGVRRGYYRRPHEDALVLSWRPPAPTGTSVR